MKLLKFKEFLNEDVVPLGFGMASSPSFYTLSSSQIRTGYDMQPVVGPMLTASDSIANAAIDHENNDNPDHTGRGYINEALKMFKEKCHEAYESKCNEAKTTNKVEINESTHLKDFFKHPTNLEDAKGWVRNLNLSDGEIKTKIKAVMKDPSKFNDLMDAMTDELNLKWK